VTEPIGIRIACRRRRRAFTLVELLVVASIIALLITFVLPGLRRARGQAKSVVCRSNLRQLHLANSAYALENQDVLVPAAADMQAGFGGRMRWHGMREAAAVDPDPRKNTFDPRRGPLAAALPDGAVKACPERVDFVTDGARNAYEAGCGGYGYNLYGVGSRFYAAGWSLAELSAGAQFELGWWTSRLARPGATVMFTDSALRQQHSALGAYLIEYSFCEPPWSVEATPAGPVERRGDPALWWLATPSIHFRHQQRANVVWCDGHASAERRAHGKADSAAWNLGWFGALDNRAFAPVALPNEE